MSDVVKVTALIDRISGTVNDPDAWSHRRRPGRSNSWASAAARATVLGSSALRDAGAPTDNRDPDRLALSARVRRGGPRRRWLGALGRRDWEGNRGDPRQRPSRARRVPRGA